MSNAPLAIEQLGIKTQKLHISPEQLENTTHWLEALKIGHDIDSKFVFIYIYILTIKSLIISLTKEDYKDSSIPYYLQSNSYCKLHGCDASCKSELIYRVYLNYSESINTFSICLLYTSPSPRDLSTSRMPSSA